MGKQTLLISINNYEIEGVKCSRTFRNIDWSEISCLIFHSSSDSDLDISLELSNIKGKLEKVIYINKSINPLYWCIFMGLDADIYDSEDYLQDASVLNYLIDNYKNTGMTIKAPDSDVETLAKCIENIASSNMEMVQQMLSNDFWLKTVNTAVTNVGAVIDRANKANIDVVAMIDRAKALIDSLERSQENTTRELEKLKQKIDEVERKERPNVVFSYNTYPVPATVQKVLYVRVYSHCRHLNTFLRAYQHYLKMTMQCTSRMLITVPKLKLYMEKYNDIPRLSPDNVDMINMGASDLYVTYEPKKVVLDRFFSQNVNLFIVVDMMFGELLLKGHMVEEFYSASGVSDIRHFHLDPSRTISPMVSLEGGISLPFIKNFSTFNANVKKAKCFEHLKERYEKLDSVLFTRK
jgi:hypothetical protein